MQRDKRSLRVGEQEGAPRINLTACEKMEAAIDPNCAFNNSAVEVSPTKP